MQLKKSRPPLAVAILLFAGQCALSQSSLTHKQFQALSAGEFVGTIQSVQVTSTYPAFEMGTVQLQVNQVIAGALTASTISFPYQRTFVASDYLSNWDLVTPRGSSLTAAVGQQVLIYFTQSGGRISIYPASNSVQPTTSGLLLGTIESIAPHHGDSLSVEISVSEIIAGWVRGTTVILPYSTLPAVADQSPGPAIDVSPASMINLVGNSRTRASLPIETLDANFCTINHGKQFLITFTNGSITGMQPASQAFLETRRDKSNP